MVGMREDVHVMNKCHASYNVLLCAVPCSLQCVTVSCSVMQRGVVCCTVLHCVAVCCSVLQRVAACCSVVAVQRQTK